MATIDPIIDSIDPIIDPMNLFNQIDAEEQIILVSGLMDANDYNLAANFMFTKYDNWPKYRVFLAKITSKYDVPCCSQVSRETKLFNKLGRCGIDVLYGNEKTEYLGTYNDNPYPEVNIIYIRLTKNKYYSDSIFPQKKAELEREILLLLTGLLGGHIIKCNSQISNSELSSLSQSLHVTGVDESVQFQNNSSENNSIQRNEVFENTGAEILITGQDLRNVGDQRDGWDYILRRLGEIFKIIERTSIVSFDYFLQNSDLYTFVFKRYLLNLTNYVYRIEEDRTHEKSIQARFILQEYGLSVELDSKSTTSKIHEYIIEFHSFQDLKDHSDIKQMEQKYKDERDKDTFAKLRREYEFNNIIMKKYWPNWGGDEKPIYKEVIKYAKTKNIYDKLIEWMDKGNNLCDPCHLFKSKIDVDIWFHDNLKVSLDIDTE